MNRARRQIGLALPAMNRRAREKGCPNRCCFDLEADIGVRKLEAIVAHRAMFCFKSHDVFGGEQCIPSERRDRFVRF